MKLIHALLLVLAAIINACCEVKEISNSTFAALLGSSFEEFRNWLILFYTPEVDESLDARAALHEIGNEYELRLIASFKKRGLQEFEEFEREMMKYPQLAEVDCGQSEEICSYFAIKGYPTMVFFSRGRDAYVYEGWLSLQELLYFLEKASTGTIDPNLTRPHRLQTSAAVKLPGFLNTQNILYVMVFLVLPFVYGYLCMAKKPVGTDKSQ